MRETAGGEKEIVAMKTLLKGRKKKKSAKSWVSLCTGKRHKEGMKKKRKRNSYLRGFLEFEKIKCKWVAVNHAGRSNRGGVKDGSPPLGGKDPAQAHQTRSVLLRPSKGEKNQHYRGKGE